MEQSEFRLESGRKAVWGMIHLGPLPGTPFYREGSFDMLRETAVESAVALQRGGADGCLVQSVDRVYSTEDESDPARTTAIALIVDAIVRASGHDARFHVGVQLMRNALTASLAVAKVAGGSFIRAGAVVGMTLSPHGMVEAQPLALAEYRRKIDALGIGVVADVDSMHFQWFGGGKSTGEVARAARNVGADAVALSDPNEGRALEKIASVRRSAPGLPVILAGHTNHSNAERLLAAADGAFVGTCLEEAGWGGRIDIDKVRAYVDIARSVES
ncbi:BtpA/SgcQ family protein [Streptomyces rochei]|uniref:BtpA/SgcQ family protein n=1 Tax=Streptomyces rochei TaxID=1928 RepID=UPI0036C77135